MYTTVSNILAAARTFTLRNKKTENKFIK